MSDEQTVSEPRSILPPRLSVSSATIYEQCPRRWRFRYVDRQPDPKGAPALVGNLAHRVLELLLGQAPAERTVERARGLARELWPETADDPDFEALGLDADGVRAFKWDVWRAIEGLWTLEDPAAIAVEATEQRITAEVAGVPFVGIVDLVHRDGDGTVVADYKSGRPPRPRYLPDKLDQVLLYAAAIEASGQPRPVRARLLYLGARCFEVEVTPEATERATQGLARTWQSLADDAARGGFDPSPGPLCGWCPYAADCPEGRAELRARVRSGRIRASAPALTLVA
jgi:putative RecB family exonuclease